MRVKTWAIAFLLGLLALPAYADHLVFGAFRSAANANNWAAKLSASLGYQMQVHPITDSTSGQQLFRVQSQNLSEPEQRQLARRAQAAGIEHWRLSASGERLAESPAEIAAPVSEPRLSSPGRINSPASPSPEREDVAASPMPSDATAPLKTLAYTPTAGGEWRWDFGLQGRVFADEGFAGQDRVHASVSVQPEYYRSWNDDRSSLTFSPFARLDNADSDRTHVDIRELFYTYVGGNWDLHVGAKRVFWGVTEFNHLVDIVNQTDLVENIDGEDKLGQPMVQWSTVQNWGILDLYLLLGHRERTFPGTDGRLTFPFEILDDGVYESGAAEHRADFAVRWSHHIGPLEFGLHHFSGTSREPLFLPVTDEAQALQLQTYYPVIDQTGIDAQAIYGDWAFKLEAMTRSGFDDRYAAFNLGVERTLVGVWGTSANLGLVGEYMFDERGDDAFNTLFEDDVVLGGRLSLNDFADTQALLGVTFDTQRSEYAFTLEASRRLSDVWQLEIEGRLFNGSPGLRADTAARILTDARYKAAWLEEEDYLQVEFKRFF